MTLCQTCGMRADLDPSFHFERYGHWPMSGEKRYRWIGGGNLEGATGVAWPAPGCDDLGSVTEGAWCFLPDGRGEEVAYYCDLERDLEAINVQG